MKNYSSSNMINAASFSPCDRDIAARVLWVMPTAHFFLTGRLLVVSHLNAWKKKKKAFHVLIFQCLCFGLNPLLSPFAVPGNKAPSNCPPHRSPSSCCTLGTTLLSIISSAQIAWPTLLFVLEFLLLQLWLVKSSAAQVHVSQKATTDGTSEPTHRAHTYRARALPSGFEIACRGLENFAAIFLMLQIGFLACKVMASSALCKPPR